MFSYYALQRILIKDRNFRASSVVFASVRTQNCKSISKMKSHVTSGYDNRETKTTLTQPAREKSEKLHIFQNIEHELFPEAGGIGM